MRDSRPPDTPGTPEPADTRVEPVLGQPAALADLGTERALLVADYHAGYEAGLRYERGVDVPSHAPERRERLSSLIERTDPDRLVVLGDLMHSIGDPGGAERAELEVLFESEPLRSLDVTIVKGNHDGAIETWLEPADGTAPPTGPPAGSVTIVSGDGIALGSESASTGTGTGTVGVCHGHTWPSRAVLDSAVVCLGHEHPCVRLEDEVGGSRVERVWLRGRLDPDPFRDHFGATLPWLADDSPAEPPQIIVLPAFNELVGGTWVNLPEQSFLSPFLPDGLADGEAYLLDGTRLGSYESV
ncbi:metallophosphoesterase [Natrialba asiatica]|uniref:Metallophosphoesterase n=1 Tax=Natrialba asiatica (strain ATCC 700177 / DSM 12278 / JCM 9576 / FERM P-10747 / NBRC 102637 / 172P1) TaxID=29540 RepID=M0APW0_NATA1|nr:metallophosphoesterase [Natrialba asiatica]ELZ00550.1 metallophosphoesterase [Natrialba asiatica DSM 12278]